MEKRVRVAKKLTLNEAKVCAVLLICAVLLLSPSFHFLTLFSSSHALIFSPLLLTVSPHFLPVILCRLPFGTHSHPISPKSPLRSAVVFATICRGDAESQTRLPEARTKVLRSLVGIIARVCGWSISKKVRLSAFVVIGGLD